MIQESQQTSLGLQQQLFIHFDRATGLYKARSIEFQKGATGDTPEAAKLAYWEALRLEMLAQQGKRGRKRRGRRTYSFCLSDIADVDLDSLASIYGLNRTEMMEFLIFQQMQIQYGVAE